MKLQLISAAVLPLSYCQYMFDDIVDNENIDEHTYDNNYEMDEDYGSPHDPYTELGEQDDAEADLEMFENPLEQRAKQYRVGGIRFVLQEANKLGIVWRDTGFYKNYQTFISNGESTDPQGIVKTTLDNKANSVVYSQLQPSAVYWITIRAETQGGQSTLPQTIKVHTLPAAAIQIRTVDFDDRCTTLQWDNPNQVRDQVDCTVRVQKTRREWREQECTGEMKNQVRICDIWPGTSWDLKIWYSLNRKKSNSYLYRFTMKPHPVVDAQASKIVMKDEEKADIKITWEWPKNNEFWGAIKVTHSPPTGDETTTANPSWITDKRIPTRADLDDRYYPTADFSIDNLKQGVVYSICVVLTKGPLESLPVCFTQDIPKVKASALRTGNQEDALESVSHLTCRVPLHLNPRSLKAIKNIFEADSSMTIEWRHPEKKLPENGYKVVLSPNTESSIAVPKIYRLVPGSYNEDPSAKVNLIVSGADFDPFIEYSISVVALHIESLTHNNPNGPEFVARIYTGDMERDASDASKPEQVIPDSCCGNIMFSSETSKRCCCEKLYEPENGEECCGSVVYNKNLYMCCDPGIDGGEPKVNQLSVGCNFGEELENTAGTLRG